MAPDKEEYRPGMSEKEDLRIDRLRRDLRELPPVGAPARFEAALRERLASAAAPIPWYRRLLPESGGRSFRLPALAYGSVALIAICVIGYYAFLRTDFTPVQNGPLPGSDIVKPEQPLPPSSEPPSTTPPAAPAASNEKNARADRAVGGLPADTKSAESPAPAKVESVAPIPPAGNAPVEERKGGDDAVKEKAISPPAQKSQRTEFPSQNVLPTGAAKPAGAAPALMPVKKDEAEYRVRGILRESDAGGAQDSTTLLDSLAKQDSIARKDSLARREGLKLLQRKK